MMTLTLLAVLMLCIGASARAQEQEVSSSVLVHPLPAAHTLSGNYLAGRFAQRRQDWTAAHTYINEVAVRDGGNNAMAQRAFLLALGAGQFAQAERLAHDLAHGRNSQDPAAAIARIFLAGHALKNADGKAALVLLDSLPESGFGDFTKPLLSAWALAVEGRFDEAYARLDAADSSGAEATFAFHRGMIAALANDHTAARAAYEVSMREGLSLHSALTIAAYFERHDQPRLSAKIYAGIDKLFDVAPTLGLSPRADLQALPADAATGAALAIFDLASMLYERRAYDSAQIYANLAHMLAPDQPYARLMLGDIAALGGQHERALAHYAAITAGAPLYWLSRLRIAEVYEASGALDQAAAVLSTLAEEKRTRLPSLVALGDIYRRQNALEPALRAYDAALAVAPDTAEIRAPLLFSRGMTLAGLHQWPAAERDLLASLALQPDNAALLNFIGYSWIERGEKSDQAFDYIRRALALRPDDGAILDSYGWALHRRGDSSAAITWLEKAVAAQPGDPAVLDHLGDVYWFAGRVSEAQFQWQRARDLTDDHAFRQGMDAKLRDGLTRIPQTRTVADDRDAKI